MKQGQDNHVKQHLGIIIDTSRDKDIPEQGLSMLTRDGFYKKDWEQSPQEGFARAATCYSFGDYEFAQRIYDYASKGWYVNASPVLSTAQEVNWPTFTENQFEEAAEWLEENVEADGLPISCFLVKIPDSKNGLAQSLEETIFMSMAGGGVGVLNSMRAPDEKSTGVMAHSAVYDAVTLAYKQSKSRRGSIASYLRIDHPEILQFMSMRDPVGGDQNKKCFNLNNAVVIPDKFMHAMIKGEDYELIDPKHGATGRFLDARHVWEELMKLRFETGEPYILFIDNVNKAIPSWIRNPHYIVEQSNLCVAPETRILTKSGYQEIAKLKDQNVEVWNGKEWSGVTVRKTGKDQRLIRVVTKDGYELECTPYHKFYKVVRNDNSSVTKTYQVEAKDLRPGDKLIKFDLPVIDGNKTLENAYVNGFFTGDGCEFKNMQMIYLYGQKRKLAHLFDKELFNSWSIQENQDREVLISRGKKLEKKFFVPDCSYTIKSRLDWFAGLLDSDGVVVRNGKTQGFQVGSINKDFLKETQLMLQTLGVQSKVTKNVDKGVRILPLNDGSGETGEFMCQDAFRLLIGNDGLTKLKKLGLITHRLETTDHEPNRECSQFIKVTEIIDEGRIDDTYCFTEPKRHMGMFNGMLTGQCSEITLWTSEKRSAVCCLSSLNLEKYEEWKDTNIVQDLVRYLDNVLEYFIRLAPPQLSKAIYSARKERAIGLGTLGFHSLLQSKGISFEDGGVGGCAQLNNRVYKLIEERAVEESLRLGKIRGEAPDCEGSGMRNSHLLAVAPNASSASLVGASPSIEPWQDNAFMADGRAGAFLIKNKYLEKELEKLGLNTKEVWKSIIDNNGSIQHLDVSERLKKVFATAREINPMALVDAVTGRQQYICQSQSFNIFVPKDITLEEMSDIAVRTWEKGGKSMYYCRAESASKANVGTGKDKPLNSVPVRKKIEYETCVSCEG